MVEDIQDKLVPEGDSCLGFTGKTCPFYQTLLVKDEDSEKGIKSSIEVPFCTICQRGDVGMLLETEQTRLKSLFGEEDLLQLDFFSSQGLSAHIKECNINL